MVRRGAMADWIKYCRPDDDGRPEEEQEGEEGSISVAYWLKRE